SVSWSAPILGAAAEQLRRSGRCEQRLMRIRCMTDMFKVVFLRDCLDFGAVISLMSSLGRFPQNPHDWRRAMAVEERTSGADTRMEARAAFMLIPCCISIARPCERIGASPCSCDVQLPYRDSP